MIKPCNCQTPPPPPQKGPSEYIPSRTYPDQFDYMMYGGAPMHRGMGPWIPAGPCGCCPPAPGPEPEPEPPGSCPPKIYRNPPDVELVAGRNIELDVDKGDLVWKYTVSTDADRTEVLPGDHVIVEKEVTEEGSNYTVNAVQFPVAIDEESEDVLYGDGTPENPLGVYDFTGATAEDDGKPGTVPAPSAGDEEKFLRGDGTWTYVPKQKQADWEQEDSAEADYIRNKPDIAGMIDTAVTAERERATAAEAGLHTEITDETNRATAAEAAATTEVLPGDNVDITSSTAADGHTIYTVTVKECTAAMMDAWIDEVI